MKFEFNVKYAIWTLLLFITEVLIAVYIRDNFIRPYLGDVLVVILLYCFLKSFVKVKTVTAVVCVLLFSYLIELLQYFNFVHLLGLEESKIARIVLGSSFEWLDLVAYTAGGLIIILAEKLNSVKKTTTI